MTTPELTVEQKPERPLLAAIFPDSGQSVPVVGDAYSVSKVTPNVLDFHDGYCTSIELTRNEEPNFTIEQALAELREMYPNCYRRIEMTILETPDGSRHEESGWQVTVYREEWRPLNWNVRESGATLDEAMTFVRKWHRDCEAEELAQRSKEQQ